MSESWRNKKNYHHWRTVVRPAVLARAGGKCQIQIPGTWTVVVKDRVSGVKRTEERRCLGVADCVHHTKGKRRTGDDMRYLVAACTPCNLKVGEPKPSADSFLRFPSRAPLQHPQF